jgi:hypothetical protein
MTSTSSTRSLLTESIDRRSQPEHATTAQTSSRQRLKIKSFTAYLGITIRRTKNPDKTGAKSAGSPPLFVDLERVI